MFTLWQPNSNWDNLYLGIQIPYFHFSFLKISFWSSKSSSPNHEYGKWWGRWRSWAHFDILINIDIIINIDTFLKFINIDDFINIDIFINIYIFINIDISININWYFNHFIIKPKLTFLSIIDKNINNHPFCSYKM